MSKNLKIGGTTYNGVDVVKIEDADNSGQYLAFVPVTKLTAGTIVIHFSFHQDWTGDGTRKIKWRPVLITMSSWAAGSGFQYYNYTEVGEWKTYELTESGSDEINDTVIVNIDATNIPTTSGRQGFGILVDLSNSNYESISSTHYPHNGDVYLQNLSDPLNGYRIQMYNSGNNETGAVGVGVQSAKNTGNTLQLFYSKNAAIDSGTQKQLAENWSTIMFIDCTGAED